MQDTSDDIKPDNLKTVGTGGSAKIEARKTNHQTTVVDQSYGQIEKIDEDSEEYEEPPTNPREKQPKAKEEKEFKLFVGGLTGDTTSEELLNYFSGIVHVKEAFVVVDSSTKKPSGFGFVALDSQQDISKILANRHEIKGSYVDCKEALSKNEAKLKELDERQRKLFVGGLPKNLKDEVLREHFLKFGKVQKAYVVKDYKSGNTRGFGFVIFADSESYNKAFYSPEDHIIQDKLIHVRETHSRKEEKEKVKTIDRAVKNYSGDKPEILYPGQYYYDQAKPVIMNYSPYPVPSTTSYRPGYVSYAQPPPQPVYYIPEGYMPMPGNPGYGPSYMPTRPIPVQIAHSHQYAYPPGEELYYVPTHPAPPTNMHFTYQPVFRMDGGQPFYQAVSTPQIKTQHANLRPHQSEGINTRHQQHSRPGSHAQIRKHARPTNHQVALSEKVISRSPQMNMAGGGHHASMASGFGQRGKESSQNNKAVGSDGKNSYGNSAPKGSMPANLDNLEEEHEEEENIERVEEI